MLISPEEAKRQCRLELDDATEDDHLGCIQEHKGRDPADQ